MNLKARLLSTPSSKLQTRQLTMTLYSSSQRKQNLKEIFVSPFFRKYSSSTGMQNIEKKKSNSYTKTAYKNHNILLSL